MHSESLQKLLGRTDEGSIARAVTHGMEYSYYCSSEGGTWELGNEEYPPDVIFSLVEQRIYNLYGFSSVELVEKVMRIMQGLAACRRENAMANYKALRLVCSRPFAPEKPHERIRARPGA